MHLHRPDFSMGVTTVWGLTTICDVVPSKVGKFFMEFIKQTERIEYYAVHNGALLLSVTDGQVRFCFDKKCRICHILLRVKDAEYQNVYWSTGLLPHKGFHTSLDKLIGLEAKTISVLNLRYSFAFFNGEIFRKVVKNYMEMDRILNPARIEKTQLTFPWDHPGDPVASLDGQSDFLNNFWIE